MGSTSQKQKEYSAEDVFTPSTPAIRAFVEREEKLNNRLFKALKTPGKQVIIYGHSGSGKTTLLTNLVNRVYENQAVTRCMEGMSFENILVDGFSKLNKYYVSQKKTTKGLKIAPEIEASFLGIKSKLGLEFSSSTEVTTQPLLPPQLTPQQLAIFFGEVNCCWILEDFHKIHIDEKRKASQIMKVFMDTSLDYKNVKLIAVGAVNSGRQVIEYDREMNNRVSEIFVPLMTAKQLEGIIHKGEKLLNISFSDDAVDKIVTVSSGLASICHQLCLNICYNRDIIETSFILERITLDDVDTAIEEYIEEREDTLKAQFDKAIKKISEADKSNDIEKILKCFFKVDREENTIDEIYSKIKIKNSNFPLEDLKRYLIELQSPERGEILTLDENSGKYSFCDPFTKSYAICKIKNKQKAEDNELDYTKIDVKHLKEVFFDQVLKAITKEALNNRNFLDKETGFDYLFDDED